MRIIIGYDGSPCADAAIDDLVRAGLPADTEARVISAPDLLTAPPLPGIGHGPPVATVVASEVERVSTMAERYMKDARQLADGGADRLRRQFPEWKVRGEARADAPHR